jgi:hypothetical protein
MFNHLLFRPEGNRQPSNVPQPPIHPSTGTNGPFFSRTNNGSSFFFGNRNEPRNNPSPFFQRTNPFMGHSATNNGRDFIPPVTFPERRTQAPHERNTFFFPNSESQRRFEGNDGISAPPRNTVDAFFRQEAALPFFNTNPANTNRRRETTDPNVFRTGNDGYRTPSFPDLRHRELLRTADFLLNQFLEYDEPAQENRESRILNNFFGPPVPRSPPRDIGLQSFFGMNSNFSDANLRSNTAYSEILLRAQADSLLRQKSYAAAIEKYKELVVSSLA